MATQVPVFLRFIGDDRASDDVQDIDRGVKRMKGSVDNLGRTMLQVFSLGALTNFVRTTQRAAITLESSLLGLAAVAQNVGEDINATTQAAEDLSADGLMVVSDSATGLKNLLLAGFGLPEAIQLMEAFKDSAAFGRQGALTFGQAIIGATEGIKNGNSILVDNAGITKNLSVILKEAGFSATDLMNASTDVNVRQALFNGLMKEAEAFTGNAALSLDTMAGTMAKLQARTRTANEQIGLKMQPVLAALAEALNEAVIPAVMTVIALVQTWGAVMGTFLAVIEQIVRRVVIAFAGLAQDLIGILRKITEAGEKVPFVGGLFGAADAGLATVDAWLDTVTAKAGEGLIEFEHLFQGLADNVSEIWRDAFTLEKPDISLPNVPGRGGGGEGTETELERTIAQVERLSAQVRVGQISLREFSDGMTEIVPTLSDFRNDTSLSTKEIGALKKAFDLIEQTSAEVFGRTKDGMADFRLFAEAWSQEVTRAITQAFVSAFRALGDALAGAIVGENPIAQFAATVLNTLGDLAIGLASFALLWNKFRIGLLAAPAGVAVALFAGGVALKAAAKAVGGTVNSIQGPIGAVGGGAVAAQTNFSNVANQGPTTLVLEGTSIYDLADPRTFNNWKRVLEQLGGRQVIVRTGSGNAFNPNPFGGG